MAPIDWTLIYPFATYENLRSIAYVSNTFVAVGSKIIVSCDGGNTWKLAKSPNFWYLTSITYGNNSFIAVGSKDTIIVSLNEGKSWKKEKSHIYVDLHSIAYENDIFVAVG